MVGRPSPTSGFRSIFFTGKLLISGRIKFGSSEIHEIHEMTGISENIVLAEIWRAPVEIFFVVRPSFSAGLSSEGFQPTVSLLWWHQSVHRRVRDGSLNTELLKEIILW